VNNDERCNSDTNASLTGEHVHVADLARVAWLRKEMLEAAAYREEMNTK
jgi:hypothetical protein